MPFKTFHEHIVPSYIIFIKLEMRIDLVIQRPIITCHSMICYLHTVPTTAHTVETHSLRFLAAVLHEVREEQLVLGDKVGVEEMGERLV